MARTPLLLKGSRWLGRALFLALVVALIGSVAASSRRPSNVLYRGDSLSAERASNDVLVSEKGTFKAGFYSVGEHAFSFAIWFAEMPYQTAVVWMANRDRPVNSRASRLSFWKRGDLALLDADGSVVWTTTMSSGNSSNAEAAVRVKLRETGNLVLVDGGGRVVWQSFDYPTDTLLPGQPLTMSTRLASRKAEGVYTTGYYRAYFNDDNVFSFVYVGPKRSSMYWPNPDNDVFENGRTRYNSSRYAVLDDFGRFSSSDKLQFSALDVGPGIKRRLTMDYDGILRLYSLNNKTKRWEVSWLPSGLGRCRVHGLCGENGLCVYTPTPGCTCPPGFKMNDPADWNQGCKMEFEIVCNKTQVEFIKLPHTDFYGYDDIISYTRYLSFEACQNICRSDCNCRGFGYSPDGYGVCYAKSVLCNGQSGPQFSGDMYVKVPSGSNRLRQFTIPDHQSSALDCSKANSSVLKFEVRYTTSTAQGDYLKYPIGFAIAFGVVEVICVGFGWAYLRSQNKYQLLHSVDQGYLAMKMGFRRFTFRELKTATNNFRDEIGRGASGVVYKGLLMEDERVVAVKRLAGMNQGEGQFWSEVSTIGRINHMNLVTMLGFCAERKHRLLVYEYLENGSLEKNLFSDSTVLTWENRVNIAVGTAKGLAYLHEECLEWVLHCDVKPQNVLLDKDFLPKVADFGLSKLFDRDENATSNFSRVRGTRGYLAPEWIMNLPITSKVDVYSFGVLLLELVTGRSSNGFQQVREDGQVRHLQLIPWIKEVVRTREKWVEEIVDPRLCEMYEKKRMDFLVKVALQCVEDERDMRPTMSQVVHSITVSCMDDLEVVEETDQQ
ncbi:G-type lectin S-receptor-like serine/threonine-protein kinase SD2-2 [Nymphaea thermarum]|nr:G-type lectin S-receptor-like serine/threonine-protein kinase SD2-2 [Nymphaea thermarum]